MEHVLKNKIIALVLVLCLNVETVSAIQTITSRDENVSKQIANGSQASDLPTGGLIHDFKPLQKDLFTDADLTGSANAKVFAGYGVVDTNNENCVNIDAPSTDGTEATSKFGYFKVYNGHTYSISHQEYTMQQCQELAYNYNGYPVEITTDQENSAVSAYYKDKLIWIDSQRDGACPSEYVNQDGAEVRFNGYRDDETGCDDNTPYTTIDNFSWTQKGTHDSAYCVMEMDTEDWKKPIQTCAPWWSVERDYMLPSSSKYKVLTKDENGNIVEFDLRNYAQSDFPKRMEVCAKVNSATLTNSAVVGSREVYCNSYYDIRLSPGCVENPEQAMCLVDECRGAIKNRCTFVDSGPAPLSYSKNSAIKNNSKTEIKNRTNIQINKYSCPIESNTDACLDTKVITMLPAPCPGAFVDANDTNGKQIKVYGSMSVDGPGKYDASGNLVKIYGKCPNGTAVEVPFDSLSQTNRVCTKRAQEVSTSEWDEVCNVSKTYNDYSVEAAINDPDIYKLDESCIRINNLEDARPQQDIVVEYQTFGLGGVSIVKATAEGGNENKFTTLLPSLYYQNVLNVQQQSTEKERVYVNVDAETTLSSDPSLKDSLPGTDCSGLGKQDETNELNLILKKYQENGVSNVYDYNGGELIRLHDIKNSSECESAMAQLGATVLFGTNEESNITASQLNTSYEDLYGLASKTGITSSMLVKDGSDEPAICIGATNGVAAEGDIYNSISIVGRNINEPKNITLETNSSVDYERCREIAICIGGDVRNSNNYTGEQRCGLNLNSSSGEAAYSELRAEIDIELERYTQSLDSSTGGASNILGAMINQRSADGIISTDKIDGFRDIYAILEFTEQDFGYVSAWNHTNYKSNVVKVNGAVVSPIAEHTLVNEDVYEDYYWDYTTHINLSPDTESAVYAGVSGGAAYAVAWVIVAAVAYVAGLLGYMTVAGYLGSLFGPWGLVIAIIIAFLVYLLTKPQNVKTFTAHNDSEIYTIRGDNYRYVENPYGYENRLLYERNGENRIKYGEWEYGNESRADQNDEVKHFSSLRASKKEFYKAINIPIEGHTFPAFESRVPMEYPAKHEWNPWAKASKAEHQSGTLDKDRYHKRTVNSHYMGATNTATIIVPYIGDYVISAYNAGGDKVSSYIVTSTSFIGGSSDNGTMMLFSNAKLGINMQLSPNLSGNSCKDDLMVDVGGGVSGVYYALGKTDRYSNFECSASDAAFVTTNKITTLKIRPVDQEDTFEIILPKPLAYPNRVFLATMGEKEDRLYRCYSDYSECTDYAETEDKD